jgi:hypothetical protein
MRHSDAIAFARPTLGKPSTTMPLFRFTLRILRISMGGSANDQAIQFGIKSIAWISGEVPATLEILICAAPLISGVPVFLDVHKVPFGEE